jgi:PadR family transcriptional regulator
VLLSAILGTQYKHIARPISLYFESWAREPVSDVSGSGDSEMCDMRGMLSFMILWLLSSRPMNGQVLAGEIGKRRGDKPNPGTIYPALKELVNRGLIKGHAEGRTIVYELTASGRSSLAKSLEYFERVFGEILRETAAPAVKTQ